MAQAVPINWKILREATDNDKEAMEELVSIYLRQGLQKVKELRVAVQERDSWQVTIHSHQFLGSSRFFGATQIVKPLASLMKMGRSGRIGSTATRLVDQTEKELNRIGQFFKVYA